MNSKRRIAPYSIRLVFEFGMSVHLYTVSIRTKYLSFCGFVFSVMC